MTHLIDNLLSFARLNRVDHFYTPAPLDLAELLEEASANLRPRLDQLGFTLTLDVGAEAIPLHADRTALLLVLDNLLDNAIKYSDKEVVVSVKVSTIDEKHVAVSIADKGIGIPRAQLKRIFKRFYRAPGHFMARVKGTGLGLFIVQSIVRKHGGRVFAESPGVGLGSTFTIQLPRA